MATQTRKKPAAKITPAKTVDAYLAAAPKDKRAALLRLRKTIKAAAPTATESVSYGIVGFKHKGESLVHFGYWKAHFALYGNFDPHAAELKAYDQSGKGTIRFPANQPLPYQLVTKIVKARIAEIEKAGVVNSVDAYLAAVPAGSRAALQKLRGVIKKAAPRATEVVNYGVPMLKLDGKNLVGYGAATAHCAFYVMSPAVMRAYATELKGYPAGKGSIRFPPDRPLPPALVTKLVKARIAEVGKKT